MLDLTADLACALDPVIFARDRLHFEPDDWQRALLRSRSRQIIENITRQGGKSTSAAVKALHVALYEAPALIPLVSPSQRQSRELFAKITGYLRMLEPVEPTEEDNKLSVTLGNGSRIVSLPGDPRTIRGLSGPKLIIVDEAAYVEKALFTALRPMLAVSGGQLILISTPNGRQGYFFEAWEHGQGWEKFKITARECRRISRDYLAHEMKELGPMLFAQEYLCEFVDAQTSAFSSEMIQAALVNNFERFIP
jgi:hypothetical protein